MPRVLVTGGAGFIGSRCVHRAVRRGDEVVVLDDLSRGGSLERLEHLRAELGASSFALTRASVTDADAVAAACRAVDIVVHLAGQVAVTDAVRNPRHDFEANALGTINVLEGLRRQAPGAALIFASTNKVYGSLAHHPAEEQLTRYILPTRPLGIDEAEPLDPHTPYACSNAAADQYVRDYARMYGLRAVVFRQSCIYGPGQFGSEDQGWVAWMMRSALRDDEVTIFGDGKQVRDLLFVEDLLDAFDSAVRRIDTCAGRAYNVGGGPDASVSIWHEFRRHLADAAGVEPRVRLAPWRPADQRVYISDVRRAGEDLGWRPATALHDGLRALREWLVLHGRGAGIDA